MKAASPPSFISPSAGIAPVEIRVDIRCASGFDE
jgi:hypothetical protein